MDNTGKYWWIWDLLKVQTCPEYIYYWGMHFKPLCKMNSQSFYNSFTTLNKVCVPHLWKTPRRRCPCPPPGCCPCPTWSFLSISSCCGSTGPTSAGRRLSSAVSLWLACSETKPGEARDARVNLRPGLLVTRSGQNLFAMRHLTWCKSIKTELGSKDCLEVVSRLLLGAQVRDVDPDQ